MKSHSIEWNDIKSESIAFGRNPAGPLNHALNLASKAFLALVPALAIVVGAAWLVSVPDLVIYLQATLWASGFVFMGLALDLDRPGNSLSFATGIALPLLAYMSSRVSAEIAIVAAALVAAWIAAAIWRR